MDTAGKVYPVRKMPPTSSIPTFIGVPVIIFVDYIAIFETKQLDVVAIMTIFAGGLLVFLYQVDHGYRLAYDNERLYQRDWGYKDLFKRHEEYSIAFDDIKTMKGKFKGNAGAKIVFMPFEFLEVKSTIRKAKDIWIYPPSFKDRDVKDLLFHLHDKRPDLFEDYVLDYMHSGKPL